MAQDDTYETFKLGDWELQSGEKIPDAHIAYKTFGDPNSPAIVYPSWFSGCKSTDPSHNHLQIHPLHVSKRSLPVSNTNPYLQ